MREMKDSGVEWIGSMPKKWIIAPIKSAFKVVSGATPKSKNESYWNGNIAWITPADFKTNEKYISSGSRYITEEGYNSCSTTLVPANSIIFTKRAPVGTVGISATAMCTNQGCLSCVNKDSSKINTDFYYYAISIIPDVFQSLANCTTFEEISYNAFANFKMPKPSVDEQNCIVKYLDDKCTKIDNAISLAQSQIDALNRYKASVITQAVTKGLDPNVEMKDSGVEWIGLMPQNWKIYPLKNVLSKPMKYGANVAGVPFSEELPRYIRITDITDVGTLKEDGKLSLPLEIAKNYLLKPDTILFARSGATVGKTFLYTADDKTAAFAGYLISAVPDQSKVKAKWLYYYCNSKAYWYWKDYIFTQSTIQNVSAGKYNKMPLPIASISEQEEIINYLDAKCIKIDAAVEKQNQIIEKLNEYKKSLIYYAVTGKIDVTQERDTDGNIA